MTDIPALRLKCMQQAKEEGLSGKAQEERAEALFEFAMKKPAIKEADEDWKEPRSPSFDELKKTE